MTGKRSDVVQVYFLLSLWLLLSVPGRVQLKYTKHHAWFWCLVNFASEKIIKRVLPLTSSACRPLIIIISDPSLPGYHKWYKHLASSSALASIKDYLTKLVLPARLLDSFFPSIVSRFLFHRNTLFSPIVGGAPAYIRMREFFLRANRAAWLKACTLAERYITRHAWWSIPTKYLLEVI